MLVDSGECLGAQVTALEQRTDEHFIDVSSQLRERAMPCINETDEHSEEAGNNLDSGGGFDNTR